MLVYEILLLIDFQQDGKIIKAQDPSFYWHTVNEIDVYFYLLLPGDIQEVILQIVVLYCHCY